MFEGLKKKGAAAGSTGTGASVVGGTTDPIAVLTNYKISLPIVNSPAVLGRNGDEVDVYFFHESVSRKHCQFELEGARLTVMDLKSTVGTTVNGSRLEPLQKRILNSGDKVEIGKEKFTIQINQGEIERRIAAERARAAVPEPVPEPLAVEVFAKELHPYEYEENEVLYVSCGLEPPAKPLSYTQEVDLSRVSEVPQQPQSSEPVSAPEPVSVPAPAAVPEPVVTVSPEPAAAAGPVAEEVKDEASLMMARFLEMYKDNEDFRKLMDEEYAKASGTEPEPAEPVAGPEPESEEPAAVPEPVVFTPGPEVFEPVPEPERAIVSEPEPEEDDYDDERTIIFRPARETVQPEEIDETTEELLIEIPKRVMCLRWDDEETGESVEIVIDHTPFSIGRKEGVNDAVIDERAVSRQHVTINETNGAYTVCDNSSKNGVYVNDEKIAPLEEVKINKGDVIRIAAREYRFEKK